MGVNDYLLRLSDIERQKLHLVVAALKVSEYTDDVEAFTYRSISRDNQMIASAAEIFDTITGLAIASRAVPHSVRSALQGVNTSLECLEPVLEELFEILRRHKRLNPYENRSEYGKLVMLLQDVQSASVRKRLGITSTLVIPLKTVGSALAAQGLPAFTEDDEALIKRDFVKQSGERKAAGLQTLIKHFGGEDSDKQQTVECCLRSIDDVYHFLKGNIQALVTLQGILRDEFMKMKPSDPFNISIVNGRGGSCFSQEHDKHCFYVLESLSLWELTQRRILDLWEASEADMLVDGQGRYDIVNTGQGFHRMCRAPKSYAIMSHCVSTTESRMGGWVGIKVIHLGDRDVPNPLVFIDKYTIIPRIVQPVVQTIQALEHIFECGDGDGSGAEHITYPGLRNLLRAKYKSYENLRLMILSDFFKHAFDGSGDDGGKCIDGRLTSAWNWCHQLDKKTYYDAFVLTGFNGFD